jgi:hypothetical protein
MSTENILHLVGGSSQGADDSIEPAGEQTESPAAAVALASETALQVVRPPVTLQQRRLLAARDLNARIGSMEREIVRLEKAFAHSQDLVKDSMAQLQQRALAVMADVMRVSTKMEQYHREQHEDTRLAEQRLCAAIADLGRQIDQSATQLQTQQECLRLLQERHDSLDRLHVHLEKVTSRMGQSLAILTNQMRQQYQVTRTHIEGLHALHREQMQAHLALTSDHDLLAIRSAQMEARLAGLHEVVNDSIGHTRRRFQAVAGVMGALAILTLGLIAWFQLNPTAVPETVKKELAGLALGLGQEAERGTAQEAALEAQSSELQELYEQLQGQQIEITRLRTQTRQIALSQRDMRLELSTLQSGLEAEDEGDATDAPEEVRGDIPLPPAIPGSRPVF